MFFVNLQPRSNIMESWSSILPSQNQIRRFFKAICIPSFGSNEEINDDAKNADGFNQTTPVSSIADNLLKHDVTFITPKNSVVYGEKEKLSKISLILKAILENLEDGEIEVKFNEKIMKAFINYSNGNEDGIFENEINLYKVAKHFSVDDLKEKCIATLKRRITEQGLVTIHISEKPKSARKTPNQIQDLTPSEQENGGGGTPLEEERPKTRLRVVKQTRRQLSIMRADGGGQNIRQLSDIVVMYSESDSD